MTPEKSKRALSVVHGLNRDHISTRIQREKKRNKFAAREGKQPRHFPSGPNRSEPPRFLGLGPNPSDPPLGKWGRSMDVCVRLSGSSALRLILVSSVKFKLPQRHHVQELHLQATLCCNALCTRAARRWLQRSEQVRHAKSSASGATMTKLYPPSRYCLFVVSQSVSVSPLLQSTSGAASTSPCRATASTSPCRASSSSLPSASSSPPSSSPIKPPCWCCRAGQSGSAAAAGGLSLARMVGHA